MAGRQFRGYLPRYIAHEKMGTTAALCKNGYPSYSSCFSLLSLEIYYDLNLPRGLADLYGSNGLDEQEEMITIRIMISRQKCLIAFFLKYTNNN